MFPPLYVQQVPGAGGGRTRHRQKSQKLLSVKQKPRTLPVPRTMTQWHLATNQWSLPAAEKRISRTFRAGDDNEFSDTRGTCCKIKKHEITGVKMGDNFSYYHWYPGCNSLPSSRPWLHRLVCRCSELNWQTDIVKTHCQWITLGRSDWSICESPQGDHQLTALAFLATIFTDKDLDYKL